MIGTQLRSVGHAQAFKPVAAPRIAPVARRVLPVVCTAAAEPAATEQATITGPKDGVAKLFFQRGSVKKVRRVLDTIRGKSYEDALVLMEYMPYRACEKISRVLISAAANAKHNKGALKTKLVVSEAYADQGPYLKRARPRAQGRANLIMKPTFHLYIKVEEKAEEQA
uniref:Large ribosomal subunit protein uL22c n=1 Tax=Chlamydomonas leiostraca TaxID=1034604 RepID=A0A7S0RPX3_9CHLO|eukprot:CAMPEP_0202859794 /NCGR_PEP_ID=MMETSP1391-20130828/1761_1 /ASSEMBLY_ACC=CAM_ASM_000867 /TAXON_ID=1034604 /ORGANISM="Chlamydomonas leiostraca, Strain SAG 11-49" /LENGTH=167 /DNA_ID=CAMNT_0049538877 /DNA_START=21 /DNA_END=524 /DNA_ORIENTATION=-